MNLKFKFRYKKKVSNFYFDILRNLWFIDSPIHKLPDCIKFINYKWGGNNKQNKLSREIPSLYENLMRYF